MRLALAALALALAGCNQILGNGNFAGPPADACTGAACPVDAAADATPMIDASMACEQQQMPPTRILGHVFAPNGTLPLAGVTVYVPRSTPAAISATTTCGCIPATGGAIIATTTGPDGSFTLTDAPSGANIPLVIQIGKWRRQLVLPTVAMCADTTVDANQSRLPKNASEGDMPRIAVTTGAADTLECLIRQLGVDDTEIGNVGDGRHVSLVDGTMPGAKSFAAGFPGGSGNFATLTALLGQLGNYDHVLLSCEGTMPTITAADAAELGQFADTGGRVFLEHYHRQWMVLEPQWAPLATFTDGTFPPGNVQVTIDNTFPAAQLLTTWLAQTGVSTNGTIPVQNARNSVMTDDAAEVQVWAHLDPSQRAGQTGDQIFSFATPVGSATPCGRVVFSDMHETGTGGASTTFPTECTDPSLTPQQDVIAFLFFDDPTCAP